MTVKRIEVESFEIKDAPGLDTIQVFWRNRGPGQGYVTVICYGSAWTAYWGAMSGLTIQQFFASADVDYLVNRMGHTQHLRSTGRDLKYLAKIVQAVKDALAAQEAPCD